MIFLDNASTTKVCTSVPEIVKKFGEELYYNPSALYGEALKVKNEVELARKDLAAILGAEKDELYFTSCATESNNWVLEHGVRNKKGNIVVSLSEHASVYECAMRQKSKGIEVRFVNLKKDGLVDENDLSEKVDENTCLVSIIHCSNETGAINDIAALSAKVKEINPKAIFHSDGVQAFCKFAFDIKSLGVDLYSVSAHKVGGLKGCGALYIRKGLNLAPFICGGGQERGLRSGTENVVGIMSFRAAAQFFKANYDAELIENMRKYLIDELSELNIIVNGNSQSSILSISVPGIKAEILQHILSDNGILIGLGSACSSRAKNNRVLSALGRSVKEIEGSIRISFGLENDMEQIKIVAPVIKREITKLRGNIG